MDAHPIKRRGISLKKPWIIVGVVVIVAAILVGVFINQKNDLQKQVDDLTAQVATLNKDLTEAKKAAELAKTEAEAAEAAAVEAAKLQAEAEKKAADALLSPLVIGEGNFSGKFSPFFADTVYDNLIVGMTQAGLMTMDRMGNIIMDRGETTSYNGVDYSYDTLADLAVDFDKEANITTYTAKLREDVVFSDGVPMTADDFIFTLYVYSDPSYVGSASLYAFPIIGMDAYRNQIPQDLLDKYIPLFNEIFDAGEDHVWAEADAWTKEQQEAVWEGVKAAWTKSTQAIADFVVASYGANAEYTAKYVGHTPEEVAASEGLQMALGMGMWGFGSYADGIFTAPSGKTWTLKDEDFPTADDYYAETYAAYEGDSAKFWETEKADTDTVDIATVARQDVMVAWVAADDTAGEGGVPNIAGIKKLDDYTVQIQTTGFSAPAIYSILGHSIAPMHHYGDPAQYDYANNKFGFPYGDISIVESKTGAPIGAGPYKFVAFENKVVYLEANELYYKGAPQTKFLQYKETNNSELIPGVKTGTIDVAGINGSKKDFGQVSESNSNGELIGDVIATNLVNNRGYGYIGLNADRVRVGGDSFSEASKNLRKALATVLAVYRDVAYDSYYGEAAVVINYPISNVIWAAPVPTDEGYKVAFSVDAEGKDIYTSEMTSEEKYVAAKEAAKGFLIAAGYTFDEETGKFTAAPEGASMTYEITVGAGGEGDHPSFSVMTDAANSLAELGITLKINDLSSTAILWDMLDAGTADLWAAAWQNNNPDPDMYQTYYSTNIAGLGGTDSNHYHVAIKELDDLIMEGRNSSDQAYRKSIYKQALDIIVDAAVEVPCYQRQNAIIYSNQRILEGTMTPDISTWWLWTDGVEDVVMSANQ